MSAEKVVAEAEEIVERTAKAYLNGTTKKQAVLILALTGTVSALGGAFITAMLANRAYKAKYELIAESEIEAARRYYSAVHDKPSLEEVAAELTPEDHGLALAVNALEGYQGKVPYDNQEKLGEITSVIQTEEGLEVEGRLDPKVTNNIFVDGKPMEDDFDYEAEIALRREDTPYIISKDEYFQGEKDYAQETLTFYEEDDTLVDSQDQPIPDSDAAVGDINMQKFGHGSGDNNVVYIRNDRMELDFEVLKSKNSYVQDVLGLRHADGGGSRKRPRFRGDDE